MAKCNHSIVLLCCHSIISILKSCRKHTMVAFSNILRVLSVLRLYSSLCQNSVTHEFLNFPPVSLCVLVGCCSASPCRTTTNNNNSEIIGNPRQSNARKKVAHAVQIRLTFFHFGYRKNSNSCLFYKNRECVLCFVSLVFWWLFDLIDLGGVF